MQNIEAYMTWAKFDDSWTTFSDEPSTLDDFPRLLIWQKPDDKQYVAQVTDGEYVLLDEQGDEFMMATGRTAAEAVAQLDKMCAAVMKRVVDNRPESV